jgi:hypothetical protein
MDVHSEFIDDSKPVKEFWHTKSPELTLYIGDPAWKPDLSNAPKSGKVRGAPMFQIAGGIGHAVNNPVHENITLAALLSADALPSEIDPSVTYKQVVGGHELAVGKPDVWEIIRGVIWNDDPACFLFWDRKDNNGSFGTGLQFRDAFKDKTYPIPRDDITRRSHFGDLQFLHAMGSSIDEVPQETRDKIMVWMECMYRLAVGDSVSEHDRIDSRLGHFFDDTTKPKGSDTFRTLLMGTTPSYERAIIARRALGGCFHIIQDSYAVGHCRRKLNNFQDMSEMSFRKSLLDFGTPWSPLPSKKLPTTSPQRTALTS